MTSSPHEPADCELAVCDRCDSYGDGYAAGKAAAHFETRVWELGAHALDCGCRPCETIRQVVRKVLLAAGEPVALPPELLAVDRWAAEPDNLAAWEAARRWLAHAAGDVDEALDVARTVKRAWYLVATWWWCCDNPEGGNVKVGEDDRVVGEVRWMGHPVDEPG